MAANGINNGPGVNYSSQYGSDTLASLFDDYVANAYQDGMIGGCNTGTSVSGNYSGLNAMGYSMPGIAFAAQGMTGAAAGLPEDSATALGGNVVVAGPRAAEIAQLIDQSYAQFPEFRAAADQAIATGEQVVIQTGNGPIAPGQGIIGDFTAQNPQAAASGNSFSTLENPSNIEYIYLNLDQTSATPLSHLVNHELFGHAYGNHRDANAPGEVGPNQVFLANAYGINPQGYGTRLG
jgi:hypothetical protein